MEGQRNFLTNFQHSDKSKRVSESGQQSRNSKNDRLFSLDMENCEI